MMPSGDATGSPERKVWAAVDAASGRTGKRGAERMGAVQDAVGGATAPLPVGALSTPPAHRRRMQDFASSAPDMAGQMKDLVERVKDEFTRVWEALSKVEDRGYDLIDQSTLDATQLSYDKRFKDIQDVISKVPDKLQELDAQHKDALNKLAEFEKDLVAWTAGSEMTTRALAELQAVTAQHQESLRVL